MRLYFILNVNPVFESEQRLFFQSVLNHHAGPDSLCVSTLVHCKDSSTLCSETCCSRD